MESRQLPERLHQSQGDSSQRREVASDQKGKSISNILKLTKEATVEAKHENVTGTIESAAGAEGTMSTLRDLIRKKRSAAPEVSIAGPSDRGSETRDRAGEDWDDDLDKEFKNGTALYAHTYIMTEEATRRRLLENPNPTKAERDRGVFNEEIFPQFIDAIQIMWSKGYETWSSESRRFTDSFKSPLEDDAETRRLERFAAGEPQPVPEGWKAEILKNFPNKTLKEGKDDHRTHQIDGSFTLDEATIEELEGIKVKVERLGVGDKEYTRIFFKADEVTTLRAVKEKCDKIAALLSPKEVRPAPPRMTEGAIAFRAKYSRDTPVAPMTAPGAINIPGRPSARETAARETSSSGPSSSIGPSSSSFEMDEL